MAADQLDVRRHEGVLSRDRARIPEFLPQHFVSRRAVGEFRDADEEIEILQSPQSLVERSLQRGVALHADGWSRLPQESREQGAAKEFAIVDEGVLSNHASAGRLNLDEAVDEQLEFRPHPKVRDDFLQLLREIGIVAVQKRDERRARLSNASIAGNVAAPVLAEPDYANAFVSEAF